MSIFARLFLLIGLVSGLSLCVVAGLLWHNSVSLERELRARNNETGQRVLTQGTRLLQSDLSRTHLMIVSGKASRVQSYFASIGATVQLEAALIEQALSDGTPLRQAPPLFEANALTQMGLDRPWLHRSLIARKPYAMFHLAPGVSRSAVWETMNRLRRLGGFYARTQDKASSGLDCDSTYFGSAQGFILGYPGGKSFFKPSYDPRQRPWYQKATAPKNPPGKPIWSVDRDRNKKTFMLTCSRTVSLPGSPPGSRAVAGVAAIDVRIEAALKEMFKVGSLHVAQGVLIDSGGRVLVSATPSRGKPDTMELDFSERSLRGFSHVAAYIRRHLKDPLKRDGLFWPGMEGGASMSQARDVFIYASVSFSGQDERQAGEADDGRWHYVVRLPVASVLEPMNAVAHGMRTGTLNISEAIASRTRQSEALVLAFSGATLLAALIVAYFAARGTARPLVQMAHVAQAVGEGDLEQQAVESSGGEIGELGRAINAMIRGLRQRDLLKESFGRYTAPSMVDRLLLEGDVRLGGAKSVATVFFSDLAGFTTLAEAMEPEVLVAQLNEYLAAMTEIIRGSEGELDKYIGDGIMAFWDQPVPQHERAARACRAALEQSQVLEQLCRKWESQGRPRLSMRIGIETGEVTVGNVGSRLKVNYTVLGDTVNFASRLESVNKLYGTRILIGETTRLQAGAAIEVREVDLLAVVGKHNPIRVYELLGLPGAVSPARREGCALYEQALEAYRARRWDEAEEHLESAQELLGQASEGRDKSCAMLLSRVQACRESDLPEGWDGALVLDHK